MRLACARAQKIIGVFCFAFVSARVVNKDLYTPNWSSMADDVITLKAI